MKRSGRKPPGRAKSRASLKITPGSIRTIFNFLPVAMLLIDARRRVQMVNESFCALFQIERANIQGKSLVELAEGYWNLPSLAVNLNGVFDQGSPFRDHKIEHDFPRVGHKDLLLHATSLRMNGSKTVVVLAFEDLTAQKKTALLLQHTEEKYRNLLELKKLEDERRDLLERDSNARREAEKSSLLKDEFLAMLSHELRTPLTTILGWAQTLRLGKSDAQKTERAIAVIEKSAKDQGQLIDDLLDVSRIQSGKMLLRLREIDPKDCIYAALESVKSQGEAKSIHIQTLLDPAACVINADPGRIEQVMRNLFTNAFKFTPAGGTVIVRTKLRRDKQQIEIQVEDTGKGIRPEFLPYLFARFSQEDSSTKRMFGGLGLGLSIVRNLVQMHKGTVSAYSAGEGKGSLFTVTLPCEPGLPQGLRAHVHHKTSNGAGKRLTNLTGLRVLVIDDLEDARDAFSAMLQSSHAKVETAASAATGLTALLRFKPHLTLCDIAMPEEDGLSFIRKVRNLSAGEGGKTPAIAVTAYASTTDVSKAIDAGFNAHLAKPVDAIELSHLIAKLASRQKKRSL